MKKVKFNGKLSLNKETIAKLNDEQMNAVNGGARSQSPTCTCQVPTLLVTCNTCFTCFVSDGTRACCA